MDPDADDDEDNDVSNRILFDRGCYDNNDTDTDSWTISMFDVIGSPHRKTSGLSPAIKNDCFRQSSIGCKLSRRKLLK